MDDLTPAALSALAHMQANSLAGSELRSNCRVALHFHPAADSTGNAVLSRLLTSGRYLSQFSTGSSNGALDTEVGGARWNWEHRLFNGAYDEVEAQERPLYGALMLKEDAYGPAPRFGSAYLCLKPEVLERTSFAYPDSFFKPTGYGVREMMALESLMERQPMDDVLDRYIEAHVHGRVSIFEDAEAVVLDPCYAETMLERQARAAGLEVQWHPGYELSVERLREIVAYRGPEAVALGLELADDAGRLTPATLDRARASHGVEPQVLKKLWHCLAAFGRR